MQKVYRLKAILSVPVERLVLREGSPDESPIFFEESPVERPVLFVGSAEELAKQFPVEKFPTPLNCHIEDIFGGRSGTAIYRLEQAEVALVGNSPPNWELATEDPRF